MKIYKGKPKLFQWSILRLALLQKKKKLGELGLATSSHFNGAHCYRIMHVGGHALLSSFILIRSTCL